LSLEREANVLIIGGGVSGTGLAYNLAKLGVEGIVLLERNYLGSGASGRCGGGARQQWTTEENVKFMKKSIEILERLPQELKFNILFRQSGYLFLARDEEQLNLLKENVRLHRKLGVETRFLDAEEAREIVPVLNTEGILGATYNPKDGVLFPFALVWGYAKAAKRLGAKIYLHTEARGFKIENGRIKSVFTDKGEIKVKEWVVNAAGAYSKELARKAGVELPNKPYRHEIMVTEPLKLFIKPMVVDLSNGLYMTQTSRGEVIGGIGDPEEESSYNLESGHKFLYLFSRAAIRVIPILKEIRLMRQWAGLYDTTPDKNPILGPVDEVENFLQINGYSGHGLMMAPYATQLLAELIAYGKPSESIERFSIRRFREGEIKAEKAVIG